MERKRVGFRPPLELGGTSSFFAGAFAGLFADTVMHPFDTVRTRLWLQDQIGGSRGYKYRGLYDAMKSIMKSETPQALYKGYGIVLGVTWLGHGSYFYTYETTKKFMHNSGMMANVVGQAIWTPMDVVKQKEQAAVKTIFRSPWEGLVSAYREGGIRNGLLRGYWAGLATYGPFSAVYFTIYEQFKVFVAHYTDTHVHHLDGRAHAAGGFVAGACAAVITSPVDTVKTRMQVCGVGRYGGIAGTAVAIFREDGIATFAKGITARLMWIAPGCSITIFLYETARRLMTPTLFSELSIRKFDEEVHTH